MNQQLYIGDQLIDLYPQTRIAITLQASDIAELKDRRASRSNRFSVPRTSVNELALGHAHLVQSGSTSPYVRLAARYMIGSLPVFRRGYAVVMGANDTSYELMLTDAVTDFFAAIDGKYLSDLDLSDYNHTWTLSDIVAAAGNTDGYIYPVAAFTQEAGYITDASTTIDIRRSLPVVYFKTILERIVQEAGFELDPDTDSYFNSDHFARLALSCGARGLVTSGKIIHAEKSLDEVMTTFPLNPFLRPIRWDLSTGGDPVARTGLFDVYTDIDPANTYRVRVQRDLAIPSSFRISCTIAYDIVQASPTAVDEEWVFALWYYDGSTFRKATGEQRVKIAASQTKSGTVTFEITEDNYTAAAGTFICVIPTVDTTNTTPNVSELTVKASGSFLEAFEYNRKVTFGDPVAQITLGDNLPKITQKDFLKGIANMVGGVFDVKDGRLSLITLDTIRSRRPQAADWTGKVHALGREVSFVVSGYGQRSLMQYKEDDTVSEGRGDGTITVADQTLEREKELFTLPWAGCDNGTYLQGKSIPVVPAFDDTGKANSIQPRVLYMDFDEVYTDAVSFTDGSTTTAIAVPPYCHFIHPQLTTGNLGFDNSLIADYYGALLSMLNKSKIIEVSVRLSEVDINAIDLFTPAYLQQEGAHFIINKVSNWLPDRLTRVELIRL